MQEACGADTPFAAVTGAGGLQYVAIFGDEVSITIHCKGIAFQLTVGVVGESAHSALIHQLSQLAEVIVGEAAALAAAPAVAPSELWCGL